MLSIGFAVPTLASYCKNPAKSSWVIGTICVQSGDMLSDWCWVCLTSLGTSLLDYSPRQDITKTIRRLIDIIFQGKNVSISPVTAASRL